MESSSVTPILIVPRLAFCFFLTVTAIAVICVASMEGLRERPGLNGADLHVLQSGFVASLFRLTAAALSLIQLRFRGSRVKKSVMLAFVLAAVLDLVTATLGMQLVNQTKNAGGDWGAMNRASAAVFGVMAPLLIAVFDIVGIWMAHRMPTTKSSSEET